MLEKDHSEFEINILSTIKEHGWFCMSVFDPDGKQPEFSYSIGFSKTLGAPEFIIFGLNRELRHSMLWEVFRQIEAGALPEEGKPWSDLLEGFDCISREAVRSDVFTEYATSADWFWKHQGNEGNPKVFQLVWPGAVSGQFPWEEGCDQMIIDDQEALWVPFNVIH